MQMLFGKHVCVFPEPSRSGILNGFEGSASGSDVAVTVELETPFLLVIPLVKGE